MQDRSTSAGKLRVRTWLGVAMVFAISGFFVWSMLRTPPVDMVAVSHINNRGVGTMERFAFEDAQSAFEQVVALAPDWLPGRINLGIALMNVNTRESLARARELFTQILQAHPDDPHGHFCLGIILRYQGKPEEAALAAEHFAAVTRLDPNDAMSWYWLGSMLPDDAERSEACFRRALQLDPYLRGPIYGLAMKLRGRDPAEAEAFLERMKSLEEAGRLHPSDIKYLEMGHYAEVIGRATPELAASHCGPLPLFQRDAKFQVTLAKGSRWAVPADFQVDARHQLLARVRSRFGATMVVLDYDRDGRPDLFLASAVVTSSGRIGDLLLRNEGDGRFTDVTDAAGLNGDRITLGCTVADFDNDGFPDLFLTGVGQQHLYRNQGSGRFEDVTAAAGLDKIDAICLSAAFVDLDQDGDLDLVIGRYGSPEECASLFQGNDESRGGGLAVFLNVGEAPPSAPGKNPAPLKPHFRPMAVPTEWDQASSRVVNIAFGDLDRDRDLDLLVLADQRPPVAILNDRLLHFHRASLPAQMVPAGNWNGALVLDANHDGISDLLFVGPGRSPALLLGQPRADREDIGACFALSATNGPPLLQAQAIDIELDGCTDVVGLSEKRLPILLRNDGQRLSQASEAFGRDADWPPDLQAVLAADLDGDGLPDLLVWSETQGLSLFRNQGNGNQGLVLDLAGQRKVDGNNKLRCNADGIGVTVTAQADATWTFLENTTLSAGLGQSRQPLLLGMGRHGQADVVRLRWPDNTVQAEFNQPCGKVVRIEETNRKTGSCPLLFAWNGQRFGFVTDFLGAGSMGERQANGSCRMPRAEESIKIEAEQLRPLDGFYVLKLSEPMDEATYLDSLQLVVLDRPAGVRVYPDERFATAEPPPSQRLLSFRDEIYPAQARDHRGRDVTQSLRFRDRVTVDGFDRRSWLGFAEEHCVELDFRNRLAKFGPEERLVLCLAGWTDYAYPESIWAAEQSGVAAQTPVLERRDAAGHWQPIAEIGFPAGLPRLMTYEITGKLEGASCCLRLRTNLEVFWDQIFIAPLLETVEFGRHSDAGTRRLEVSSAALSPRGCVLEHSPDGRQPALYDYDRLAPIPASFLSGHATKFGDVTQLLRHADDRFVIFGPGDEVTVRFDARSSPELPEGWTRSFVLRTRGYCKDSGPFTATGATIAPLPFARMSTYPYGREEAYPSDALHLDYLRLYQTRVVGAAPPPGR